MKIKYIGSRNGKVNAKGTYLNVIKGQEFSLSEDLCNHLMKTGLWELVKENVTVAQRHFSKRTKRITNDEEDD